MICSSTVKVNNIKEVIERKKKVQAAKDGIDPDSDDYKVRTRDAQMYMVVAAVKGDVYFPRRSCSLRPRLVFARSTL